MKTVNNLDGLDGEQTVELWTDPTLRIDFTGDALLGSDRNKPAFGIDNNTATKSATGNPQIGLIVDVLTATRGEVQLRGLGV